MKTRDFIQMAGAGYRRRYEAQEIAWNTLNSAQSALRSFKRYCADMKKEEEEIFPQTFAGYKQWCLARGNKAVTVNQKLIPLLQTWKKLFPGEQAEGIYFNLRPRRYGEEAEQPGEAHPAGVRHLSARQLEDLIRLYQQLPEGWDRDCLDLFLFSFHACGLRISDLVTLEWRHLNLKGAVLSKVLVKTKAVLSIPLSAPALEILGRWKAAARNPRFVFDLLPHTFNIKDDAALSQAIDSRNHAVRLTLNRLGREMGLPFPLGMHVARHTFAVMALNGADVNVHLISHLLGHSSVVVTEKVYAKFLLSTLGAEVRKRLTFMEFSINNDNRAGVIKKIKLFLGALD